ncbi:MAG: hypothetical protein ABI836_06905 [Gemmatimonadota bacterium]
MAQSILGTVTLAVIALTGLMLPAEAQRADSTMLRPTSVMVKITKDPNAAYNGIYTASGISTKCGLADYSYPHRMHSFAVIFPDDLATIAVTSVNFDADSLMSGDSVGTFDLSVGIRIGQTGTPPLYVIRAKDPQYGEPGIATRTTLRGGADSLHVFGVATKGTKLDVEMWLVCQP